MQFQFFKNLFEINCRVWHLSLVLLLRVIIKWADTDDKSTDVENFTTLYNGQLLAG